jgi:hypothetical protein
VLRNYPGSVNAIAELMTANLQNGLVLEALSNMEQKFATIDNWGPTAVADFREIGAIDGRERVKRRAFANMQNLVSYLPYKCHHLILSRISPAGIGGKVEIKFLPRDIWIDAGESPWLIKESYGATTTIATNKKWSKVTDTGLRAERWQGWSFN